LLKHFLQILQKSYCDHRNFDSVNQVLAVQLSSSSLNLHVFRWFSCKMTHASKCQQVENHLNSITGTFTFDLIILSYIVYRMQGYPIFCVCVSLNYIMTALAQSSAQAPFTSEIVGSIIAVDSCEKSLSTNVLGSLRGRSSFLPQGKLTECVRIHTQIRIHIVRKVISQLLQR
jgi:hypothetical protein